MTKYTQRFDSYGIHFKLYAIQLFVDEGMSYESITNELKLPSKDYIKEWVNLYQKYGLEGLGLYDK